MALRRLWIALAGVSVASGLAATAFWLGTGQLSAARLAHALPILLVLMALTTLNLALRWLRWHFLVRRFLRTLPTRASLKLYFGTLPAFATPFYLGELLRSAIAARRQPGAPGIALRIWAAERVSDTASLGLFLLAAQLGGTGRWLLLATLALAAAALAARLGREGRRVLGALGATSLGAWALPVAGLWWLLGQLGEALSPSAAGQVFSLATLLGGASLLPLGFGVTGSSMIFQLDAAGVGAEAAILAVALFRAGTAWYALGLGLLALLAWRRELLRLARAAPAGGHFDSLAPAYEQQIAHHMRDRVVERKVAVMLDWLERARVRPGARVLEIGCGHGWYAARMARGGFALRACDLSRPQLAEARRYLAEQAAHVPLAAADARSLPFADRSFEGAYGVNVLHHITDPAERDRALREIVRVLAPGGSFYLHEINTENPLFTFYMGYVFPLLRDIDDGTELWIRPSALPAVDGADWDAERVYLTFLPEFTPRFLVAPLQGLERALERSRFRSWSAHYAARLVRRAD